MSFWLEDGVSFGSGGDFSMGILLLTVDRRIRARVSVMVRPCWTTGVLCLSYWYCNVG